MILFGIDRFENELAVLVDNAGKTKTVQRVLLPQEATEGDILSYDGEAYVLNSRETEARRREARALIDELFK